MKTSPVAWLCMNKKSGSLFALTQEQLNELGYGNISMPEFEKVAPLYCYEPSAKLWLWKNFVDGKPEYWAFDNPYPTNLDNGDPQTLGQPCGYAIFKPSRDGSCGRTEEQVLSEMKSVTAPPQQPEQGPDYEAKFIKDWNEGKVRRVSDGKRMVPQRDEAPAKAVEWQGLTDEEYESMAEKYVTNYFFDTLKYARAIETKLRVKNGNV